ncbi:hypothetical protein ACHAW6_012946 [Cyclotella cf. meneghiniana]
MTSLRGNDTATSRWFILILALLLLFDVSGSGLANDVHAPIMVQDKLPQAGEFIDQLSLRRRMSTNGQPSIQTASHSHAVESRTKKNPDATNPTHPIQRRTKDVEDVLNGMAHKDPTQWDATEWVVFALFISFFGWIACCLCSMCCCGRGGGNTLLGWLCCYEICCRDGRDLDVCCDYALR